MTYRTITALTLSLIACATLLSGCDTSSLALRSTDSADQELSTTPNQRTADIAGPPLPAGSHWIPAGRLEPQPLSTGTPTVKSYRPDSATPAERIPHIVGRGRLIVGVDQSLNLSSYRDPATGEIQGFEVDIAHEIARDIFGDPNHIDFRFLESSDRIPALESGRVDLVIRSMAISPDLEKDAAFSIPYLQADTRMLALTSSGITSVQETAGRTICASESSAALNKAATLAPAANLLVTRSWGDCQMALQLGQADVIMVGDTLLSGMAEQDPYTEIVGEVLGTAYYGVGVRKPDDRADTRGLIRQVNATLERIFADGTWNNLFNSWFGAYLAPRSLPAPLYFAEDEEPSIEGRTP
ncbi:MAG: transporter substrate-binding domain-containing protein [Corynebacterium sp.]|nr:transporter substrate-binding domain-containing protein [Corynebacterium sp.]